MHLRTSYRPAGTSTRPVAGRLRRGWPVRRTAALGALLLLLVQLGCGADRGPAGGPAPAPAPARPRVLIFGDSYTQGHGATPETEGFAYRVGGTLGWDVTVDGLGGTGYVFAGAGGRKLGTYLARLGSAPAGPFDLVVLQGSSNDEREPVQALPDALAETVPAFRARYPGARIVMMGPVPTYGPPVASKVAVNDVLRRYADDHGIAFIDPVGESWFARGEWRRLTDRENGHPNNAGYGRICDRFVIDATRLRLLQRTG